MKIAYINYRFHQSSLSIIKWANSIISEYQSEGFDLTLRQLYYQMVARDLIPNTKREYARIGGIISKGRLAGYIDWESIVDRTRTTRSNPHWDNPQGVIAAAQSGYLNDLWKYQAYRPEVWIEKDALTGVISGVCRRLDVPYFSCRGYSSQSAMWRAASRMYTWGKGGQIPIIFHLGDHDPSGIDMTRDIEDRMAVFGIGYRWNGFKVERIALNWEQIEEYSPPSNFAKATDSRFASYVREYGTDCWELDALDPRTMVALIEEKVSELIDDDLWEEDYQKQEKGRAQLGQIKENYTKIVKFLSTEN